MKVIVTGPATMRLVDTDAVEGEPVEPGIKTNAVASELVKCGEDIKVGDTIILVDDDGIDRKFTVSAAGLGGKWGAPSGWRGVAFGDRLPVARGNVWFLRDGDWAYREAIPLTDEEKLAIAAEALHQMADGQPPSFAELALRKIGEW